jgi:adenylosuccinate synthase
MTKTDLIIRDMTEPGKAHFVVGGQFGSESKGAAAAWLALQMAKRGKQYDYFTCNSGAQAGHTSIHNGKRRVSFNLPTAHFITHDEFGGHGIVYLNEGSVIDPDGFLKELSDYDTNGQIFIDPNAAIITDECKEAERDVNSSQTKIASTQKGVGEAISRKVRRAGMIARDCPKLKEFVRRIDLNTEMGKGASILVEVPQGVSLSIRSDFYPHTTSRNCTPAQAMSDAGIHPSFYGSCLVVIRTFPIRVGNIVATNGEEVGNSGECYPDQHEISWNDLGVEAEITTVTKRIRRVFTFSKQQLRETLALCRPDAIFLTFTNYIKEQAYLDEIESAIFSVSKEIGLAPPRVIYEFGPTTADVGEEYSVPSNIHGSTASGVPETIRRGEADGKLDKEDIPGARRSNRAT